MIPRAPRVINPLISCRMRMPKRTQSVVLSLRPKRFKASTNDPIDCSAIVETDAVKEEARVTVQLEISVKPDDNVAVSTEEAKKSIETERTAQEAVVDAVVSGQHPKLRDLFREREWLTVLEKELKKEYISKLQSFVESEWEHPHSKVYPPAHLIFNAFHLTPYNEVRVVLLGQDPYHGLNQATGLCFSVPKTEKLPSSLRNVYKEIEADIGIEPAEHGDLTYWAKQGVLLLNNVLTVRGGKANSHRKKGWERFTSCVISLLNRKKKNLVFILWGAHAQNCGKSLDRKKHLVLTSAHPSGLSAYRGFFGCKHFSQCNAYLESNGIKAIDWKV